MHKELMGMISRPSIPPLRMQRHKKKPSMIVIDTIKGKGCSFAEEPLFNHHITVSEQGQQAMKELEEKLET